MGGVRRGFFQGTANHLGDVVIADAPGRSGPGLIIEAVEALLCEASSPLADGVGVDAEALHNGLVFEPLCCGQDDARPPCQSLGGFATPCQALKFAPFGVRQGDSDCGSAHDIASAMVT